MIQIGTILDNRYLLREEIGFGGMANVYKAKCVGTDYYVAVKILKQEYNDDEAFVRRFIAEAKATENLDHPNIVKIYDAGRDRGLYYIVMELAEGMTLKQYIRRYGRLSVRETVDFGTQIASAILAAHDHGIIHRDIKPQNILVSEDGRIRVTDFGIAKAVTGDTVSSNAMGSVRYLSPEQARGGYSDKRSDIYSLGITMYEMATGRVPFDGDNSVAIALKHLREPVVPPRDYFPDIPASLENIILKCVRKKPEERYQTAGELIHDLEQVFESPDGSYVYLPPVIDDSPTKDRSREEIETIRKTYEEDSKEQNGSGGASGRMPPPDDGEDKEDDENTKPGFERMVLLISIVLGIAFAAFLVFVIGSSLHLFGNPFRKGETTEAASTTQATEATTQQEYVTVPDFMKLTKGKALERAEKHSLHLDFSIDEYPDYYDEDLLIVTNQEPKRGTQVEAGSVIRLSLGPDENLLKEQVEVPDVVGLEEKEAVEKVEKAGLAASVIYASSESVKQGYVIRQNPAGSTMVDRGFTITITVSRGVGRVKVPSLTGVSRDAAEKMLQDVGLKLGSVGSDYSGDVGVGDVIRQDIPSGSLVDRGTEVSITISLGEKETWHYEGVVSVETSPFKEEETGSLKIVVKQGEKEKVLYNGEDLDQDSFPINVDYVSDNGDQAQAIIYVNGEEYDRYTVELSAVAD